MKPIEQNLTQYAAYHRDRRNIATHCIGVPMIVFSVVLALDAVTFAVNGMPVSLAAITSVVVCAYYLRQDFAIGVVMALIFFAMCGAASEMSARFPAVETLGIALAIFVAGWALQFLGHKYEGMKPAFYDDVMQLVIGPMFVLAEVFFALGARKDLRGYIESRVGPTMARRDGAPLDVGEARPLGNP